MLFEKGQTQACLELDPSFPFCLETKEAPPASKRFRLQALNL
jgi:hypothetical protein